MATVDFGGDTLVVGSVVSGVNTPGIIGPMDNPAIVGMNIGGVIFGMQTANNTAFTVTTMTTLQPVFNISTNGAMTVSSNQTYMFEAQYVVQAATNNSHAWAVGFGGTATITNFNYALYSTLNLASGTATANTNSVYVSTATTPAVSAFTGTSTASGEQIVLSLLGMFTVSTGGTLIPQVKLNVGTTPTTTITVLKGSYFGAWPVGNATTQTVGSWS